MSYFCPLGYWVLLAKHTFPRRFPLLWLGLGMGESFGNLHCDKASLTVRVEKVYYCCGRCHGGIVSLLARSFSLSYSWCHSIFSFLPPTNTLRGYHRRMMARTVEELGTVYCAIVSFANSHQRAAHGEVDKDAIIKSLIAIRLKLKRSLILKTNIIYEVCQL